MKICKHFGVCGGCSYLDKPYEDQLEEKVKRVEDLFGVKIDEVYPSPKQYYYRNRMDFAVSEDLKIGLNVRGRWWEIVDLEECLLLSPEADEIRRIFKEYMLRHGLRGWNRVERRGSIRFLSIIEGKFTDERMIFITSFEDLGEKLERFSEELESMRIGVSSLILGINPGIRDDARAEDLRVIKGSETIVEKIDSRIYHLHPNTFFQPNPYTLDKLIRCVVELLDVRGCEEILELFSGIGTFTLDLARIAAKVYAVEENETAVKIAEMNLRENWVRNVELINERAERVSVKYDYVVLDPPRTGLSYKLVKKLRKAKPRRIVYVSCNPETQLRDIRQLGYKIDGIVLIDQFPQTPLVESVVALKPR